MAFLGRSGGGSRTSGGGGRPPSDAPKYATPKHTHCPKCGWDLDKPVEKAEKPSSTEVQDLFDSLESAHDLSSWEEEFFVSVQDQYEKKKFLTDRQLATLRKIAESKGV